MFFWVLWEKEQQKCSGRRGWWQSESVLCCKGVMVFWTLVDH